MTAYFQKSPWTPFIHAGTTYDLAHLDEYQFTVIDADAQERLITVTFSDHCFTRTPLPNDDPALFYPGCSRNPGIFAFDRYRHSFDIAGHITHASGGKVWNAARYHDNYAIVPTVDKNGRRVLYAIIFSLERGGRDLPVDLHMRIRSAYPCDEKPVPTFGEVRFNKLVALRMKGKSPGRMIEHQRRTPRLS